MEQPYSNRELDMKFLELTKIIGVNQDQLMERIELLDRKNHDKHLENTARLEKIEQNGTLTNGSVGNLKAWRSGITMCLAIISFVVLPLIIYSFQLSQENLKNTILLQIKH